jgi:hypothetical protein
LPPLTNPANRGDLRRAPRARVHLAARYASANLSLEGYVTDISTHGLFFSADYLDDQGQLAEVSIEVPGLPAPLKLHGEVRWLSDRPHAGGMGLVLCDLGGEERTLLAALARQADEALGAADDDGGRTPIPTGMT